MKVIKELNKEELDFDYPVKIDLPKKVDSNIEETKELDLGDLNE